MKRVYITFKIPQLAVTLLQKRGLIVDINQSAKNLTFEEFKEVFGKYDAVLTLLSDKIDEDVLNAASGNLKIISNFAVGWDNIDVLAAKRRGIVVTNTPGVAGESVAEHTFGLILTVSKKLIEADRYVRLGKYQSFDPELFLSNQIWGKTLGIVGLGRIGTFVGHIGYGGFRMKILYHDLVRFSDFELLTEAKFASLPTLLSEADVVTLHVPLTPLTRHLIGKEELMRMKNSTILINTCRGQVVDEQALIWALEEKKIAGAGLDVFENEGQIDHRLTALANVVLTPHVASATVETRQAMAKMAAENIIDVFAGKTPFGLVKVD